MYPLVTARIIEALNILGGTDGIVGVASFPNRWVEQYSLLGLLLLILFGLRRLVVWTSVWFFVGSRIMTGTRQGLGNQY